MRRSRDTTVAKWAPRATFFVVFDRNIVSPPATADALCALATAAMHRDEALHAANFLLEGISLAQDLGTPSLAFQMAEATAQLLLRWCPVRSAEDALALLSCRPPRAARCSVRVDEGWWAAATRLANGAATAALDPATAGHAVARGCAMSTAEALELATRALSQAVATAVQNGGKRIETQH